MAAQGRFSLDLNPIPAKIMLQTLEKMKPVTLARMMQCNRWLEDVATQGYQQISVPMNFERRQVGLKFEIVSPAGKEEDAEEVNSIEVSVIYKIEPNSHESFNAGWDVVSRSHMGMKHDNYCQKYSFRSIGDAFKKEFSFFRWDYISIEPCEEDFEQRTFLTLLNKMKVHGISGGDVHVPICSWTRSALTTLNGTTWIVNAEWRNLRLEEIFHSPLTEVIVKYEFDNEYPKDTIGVEDSLLFLEKGKNIFLSTPTRSFNLVLPQIAECIEKSRTDLTSLQSASIAFNGDELAFQESFPLLQRIYGDFTSITRAYHSDYPRGVPVKPLVFICSTTVDMTRLVVIYFHGRGQNRVLIKHCHNFGEFRSWLKELFLTSDFRIDDDPVLHMIKEEDFGEVDPNNFLEAY